MRCERARSHASLDTNCGRLVESQDIASVRLRLRRRKREPGANPGLPRSGKWERPPS